MALAEKLAVLRHGMLHNNNAQASFQDDRAEDQESLLSAHSSDERTTNRAVRESQSTRRLFISNCLLAVLLVVSATANIFTWVEHKNTNLDKICYKHTSAFPSPMDSDIEPHYTVQHVNGSFNKQTIYRMPGSPEVDAAWNALGAHLLPMAIPEDEGPSYGLDPGQVKRVPEQGGGFVAILESTHHIHCLNLMRQASHWDYEYYRTEGLKAKGHSVFSGPEDGVRMHFTHCMDMLRQRLMCDADPAPLGQVWVKDYGPLVFDTVERKCRNFTQLVAWARERQMPAGQRKVRIREGDKVYSEFP